MKLENIIDKFINQYCRTEKNYSEHTVETYSNSLKHFTTYLESLDKKNKTMPELEDITSNTIKSFMWWIADKQFKRNSLRQIIITIKSLFRYCYKKEILNKNIAENIVMPKKEKKMPSYLLANEVEKLLKPNDNNSFISLRNTALMELLYSTGLRISEALQLDISAINNNQIKVFGKGRKERIVPIGDIAIEAINKYKIARNSNNISTNKLFVNCKGNPLSAVSAWKIVNTAMQGITDAKQKSPHTLRHSFATHLLDNGAEFPVVSQLLGHSQLATTEIYTHVSIGRLKQSYKNAHPKA